MPDSRSRHITRGRSSTAFHRTAREGETSTAAQPFIVASGDYAAALDIVGEHLTVPASGEATGGYEIFLQRGPEGSGPPPHSHPWDESFFVVRGEIELGIGADTRTASPGRRARALPREAPLLHRAAALRLVPASRASDRCSATISAITSHAGL